MQAEREVFWSLGNVVYGAHSMVMSRALMQLVDQGVFVRVLCSQQAVRSESGKQLLRELQPKVQVRITRTMSQELVVADDSAIVDITGAPTGGRVMLVQESRLVGVMRKILCGAWDEASPVSDPLSHVGGSRRRVLQETLTLMSKGYKDDVAARKMGLSVRTYRRHVADILQILKAESRFQAGVRAAEVGLFESAPKQGESADRKP
ncbi:hypothetical protein Sm713_24520 [Streptomyces sp. TS71-3]|nr:hypothetical protein Sm713_24520 [Streptomyces sp. TS71-3]